MSKNLIQRIARLVTGVAHNTLGQAEEAVSVAVMEQAIREIDEAVKEVRVEIGQHEATRHNVKRRLSVLDDEHHDLSLKIDLAVKEGAEGLAEAGVGRQLDIETQQAVLERSTVEAEEEIAKLSDSLAALQACRRETLDRLRDLKAAPPSGGDGVPRFAKNSSAKALDAIEGARQLGESLTGIPADSPISGKDLDNLAELHRQHSIRERLAEHRARMRQPD
jgi:phage shock protein A